MTFTPLSELVATDAFHNLRLVATDMDGTLTHNGKFTVDLLQAFADLATAGIEVIIVTGRSAGWVSGLTNYLPIAGAIAENGGLFYQSDRETPLALTAIPHVTSHRTKLAQCFQQLQTEFPQIHESSDNCFRITDWTFDVFGLNPVQLQKLVELCQNIGWGFTYSNVQCHIKPIEQNKATGLLQVLHTYYPQLNLEQVATVGDSPNDASLFDPSKFPLSVGVSNVLHYANQLVHQPMYMTNAPEVQGFCELAQSLSKRK
ncbi:HAD family hydrolase [Gloeocapsopsis sp. IPPAS B-1203]|uniref:HAD family hydrolase n=1 Tax=Gloeocapsopsis sp. IPPAS B-1203 TaxID=2049454 RepID=UPI000C18FA47|nr:HAD family hydrolase [Gloeocapsopsis sp. IPPAS B-1203]PIG90466.1 HAD family hydrolase [Gloeocapsopsis sp. IPPAS B-1203]